MNDKSQSKIALINGPNLNLLGTRNPEIYGITTLADIVKSVNILAAKFGWGVTDFQSNHEGAIVDAIHQATKEAIGIIINPAAFTHTSIAIHDALEMVEVPIIEVHLSNIYKREEFRHHSYVSKLASVVISGCGPHGYDLAVLALSKKVQIK
jgi:3-dehydroquinate dehydratase II